MTSFTIRNVPEATYRVLKQRAALHGRSIFEEALHPKGQIRLVRKWPLSAADSMESTWILNAIRRLLSQLRLDDPAV